MFRFVGLCVAWWFASVRVCTCVRVCCFCVFVFDSCVCFFARVVVGLCECFCVFPCLCMCVRSFVCLVVALIDLFRSLSSCVWACWTVG